MIRKLASISHAPIDFLILNDLPNEPVDNNIFKITQWNKKSRPN